MFDFVYKVFRVYEARLLLGFLCLAGFFLAMGLARIVIWSDKERDIPGYVMVAVGAVIVTIGCIPGFILLITFRWGMILRAILLALAISAVFYLLFHGAFFRTRALKYRKNPLMQEILTFCRNNRVEGILCFQDGVVFYNTLLNESMCKRKKEDRKVATITTEEQVRQGMYRPDGLSDYLNYPCVGRIRFADRDYPNLPNVEFFGAALAKELSGFRAAYHSISTRCEQGNTIHITHVHESSFVYSKEAMRRLKAENARKPKPPKQKQKQIQQNQWD